MSLDRARQASKRLQRYHDTVLCAQSRRHTPIKLTRHQDVLAVVTGHANWASVLETAASGAAPSVLDQDLPNLDTLAARRLGQAERLALAWDCSLEEARACIDTTELTGNATGPFRMEYDVEERELSYRLPMLPTPPDGRVPYLLPEIDAVYEREMADFDGGVCSPIAVNAEGSHLSYAACDMTDIDDRGIGVFQSRSDDEWQDALEALCSAGNLPKVTCKADDDLRPRSDLRWIVRDDKGRPLALALVRIAARAEVAGRLKPDHLRKATLTDAWLRYDLHTLAVGKRCRRMALDALAIHLAGLMAQHAVWIAFQPKHRLTGRVETEFNILEDRAYPEQEELAGRTARLFDWMISEHLEFEHERLGTSPDIADLSVIDA